MASNVVLVGSASNHGGSITASGQGTDKYFVNGRAIAVDGAPHSCPIPGHGVTPVSGNAVKYRIFGKRVCLDGAVAGCGAVINGNLSPNYRMT